MKVYAYEDFVHTGNATLLDIRYARSVLVGDLRSAVQSMMIEGNTAKLMMMIDCAVEIIVAGDRMILYTSKVGKRG